MHKQNWHAPMRRVLTRLLAWLPLVVLTLYGAGGIAALHHFGRADNGDFSRFMLPYVEKPADLPVNWLSPDDPRWSRRFSGRWIREWTLRPRIELAQPQEHTSAEVIWVLGVLADRVAGPSGSANRTVLDIRWFGVLGGTLLLAAMIVAWWALRSLLGRGQVWTGWLALAVLAPVAVAVFDLHTTSFLNSFYRDGAAHVWLAWLFAATCAAAAEWKLARGAIAAAAALVATSAQAHGDVAMLVAAALGLSLWFGRRPRGLVRVVWALAIVGLMGITVFMVRYGRQAEPDQVFNALYLGVLAVADHPAELLDGAGLPRESVTRIGRTSFDAENVQFVRSHGRMLNRRTELLVLRSAPENIPRLLLRAFGRLHWPELPYSMTEEGAPPNLRGRFLPWSVWGEWSQYLPRGSGAIALLSVALAASALIAWRREGAARFLAISGVTCATLTFSESLLAVLGNGFVDLERHLLLASLCYDLALWFPLAALVAILVSPASGPLRWIRPVRNHHLSVMCPYG